MEPTEEGRRRALRAFASKVANGDGEDLVQEALARALSHGVSCESLPWLKTVVRRLSIDRARRAREVPWGDVGDLEPISDHEGSPDELLLASERRRAVRDALDSLPPRYRDALIAFADDGRCASVASRLGLTPQASWSLVSRARRRLRDELRRTGFAPLGFCWKWWPAAMAPLAVGIAIIVSGPHVRPVSPLDSPETRTPVAAAANAPATAVELRSASAGPITPAAVRGSAPISQSGEDSTIAIYRAETCTPEETGSVPVYVEVEVEDEGTSSTTKDVFNSVPSEVRRVFAGGCEK